MALVFFGLSLSLTWLLVGLIAILFVIYDQWCRSYWARHGMKSPRSKPVVGNIWEWTKGVQYAFTEYNQELGKVYGVYDFYRPALAVSDLDVVKDIFVKHFASFNNRKKTPLFSKALEDGVFFMEHEHWKDVRGVLSPTFSGSKMKHMSPIINDCADMLLKNIGSHQERNGCIECRDLFGCYVMDTIASCAFGLKVDSQENPNDPFVSNVKKAFSSGFFDNPVFLISSMLPWAVPIFEYMGLAIIPNDVTDFFCDVIKKTIAARDGSAGKASGKTMDYLQILLNARNQQNDDDHEDKTESDIHDDLMRHHSNDSQQSTSKTKIQLTESEVMAQALVFFIAGYETTNTTTGYACYLLASNQDVQARLVAEIDEMAPTVESVGYSTIAKMQYLDQVFCETLRIYPAAAQTDRVCNEPFTVDGFTIPTGMQVFIPIYSIHHDPDIWPQPERFDPDRFSKENRAKQHPFAWIPFGGGPRICLGMRFALMEAKIAMVRVLQEFRLETCPQTEIPPKTGTNGFISPPNGVTLRAIKRSRHE